MVMRAPPTLAAPPRPPTEVLYEYEERRPGRPVWPWVLVLLLVLTAATTGWFVVQQIRDELAEAAPVAVPLLIELEERQAVALVLDAGLVPDVKRIPNRDVEEGFVFAQSPDAGEEVDEGSHVELSVSDGPPMVEVPDVVGESRDDAVAALARDGLDARVVAQFSDKPVDTVTGQDPKAGERIEVGTRVRINVSKGLEPVSVPPVVGDPFETAVATLEGAGFRVRRQNADSDQPRGTVIDQSPDANTLTSPGATVTLTVSRGPVESTVPDVTSLDEESARAQLEDSGFQVEVVKEPTIDPSQDGFVLRQEPEGGSRAPKGSMVRIIVGELSG